MTGDAQRSAVGVDLGRMLATGAGMLAAAGGLIHLVVIRDHIDHPALATGFGAMALSQFAFAVAALARPSPRLLLGGAALHGAMTATWLASRTVGLGFVPGAEEPAAEGVADIVAQVFSLGWSPPSPRASPWAQQAPPLSCRGWQRNGWQRRRVRAYCSSSRPRS